MMRAMLFDAPDDPAAWTADLQYLLGPDLLVAPMVTAEPDRQVYFPDGRWVDHATGEIIEGGRYRRITAPLDRIPLYVRHGALIPVAPPGETVADGPFPDLTVVSWGGRDARTVIRDVDGDTLVTAVREGDTLAVTVDGPARVRQVTLAPVPGGPARVTCESVSP
jgi:alpha-D-xyloside xylohydrolase